MNLLQNKRKRDETGFTTSKNFPDINNKTMKYFLLDKVPDIKTVTLEKMARIYNEAGLNCDIKR